MIEGCLLTAWAFLLLTCFLWEAWTRQFGVQCHSPPPADAMNERQEHRRIKKCSMDECEISAQGGGEENSEGVTALDGSAFNLQELQVQLRQMECMIKMLMPYKEKLEAMHQIPSVETTCRQGRAPEDDLSLSDLCGRLKVLESENQSLVIENGNQRLKFERCLDQVAVHVAHVLLAQQTLRGECLHLHQRVLRLEQQNHQLFRCFQHQLESLRSQSKEQTLSSPMEHIYEIPEFFQRETPTTDDPMKPSPDDKPISSSSMYDSLEASFPSGLCSASWNPVPTASNQIHFGVRSATIPPYPSPRQRSHCMRCAVDSGCHGNYHLATPNEARRNKKDYLPGEREIIDDFGNSCFRRKGNQGRLEQVDPGGFTNLGKESLGMNHPGTETKYRGGLTNLGKELLGMNHPRTQKKYHGGLTSLGKESLGMNHPGTETKYANLSEENGDGDFEGESMESSVEGDDLSPAADLLCLSDSFYEQFRIGSSCSGQLRVSKRRGVDGGEFRTGSEDKETEELCIESDDAQSLFPGSEDRPLTRASSVSLSELLGRTPTLTSDSDTVSVDDYPFLDLRAKGSIIEEENSNEDDSDYEELVADEESVGGLIHPCNAPAVRNTETVLPPGVRKNKETLAPSVEENGAPPGARNMGFCGGGNRVGSPRLGRQANHCGPHINVLSRCSNKKLKIAADKIFSASYRVRPVARTFREDDGDRYSTGSTSPLDRTASREAGNQTVVSDEIDFEARSRPSFLKISNFHRHPGKSTIADVGMGREELSPSFLPSGEFLWDGRFLGKTSEPLLKTASSHSYVNISTLNFKQKPRPLLARRKMTASSNRATTAQGSSKRGCSRSAEVRGQHKASPSKTVRDNTLSHSNSGNSSPDSDVQHSACSSSSDSETVAGEKLPSSQDDGYSSNSLPSETSSRLPVESTSRLRRPSKRDEQKGFSSRRKVGGVRRIVPILGSREELSTFEEGCEGKSELDRAEADLKRMELGDDDSVEEVDVEAGVCPLSRSDDVVSSQFVEEIDSSHEEIPELEENNASGMPVHEFLTGDEDE